MKLAIIIPAYNEEKTIGKVLKSLPRRLAGVSQIDKIVVDDGSSDQTGTLARRAGAQVLTHPINLGLGGALRTGLDKAKSGKYDIAITFDADGQHSANDIKNMIHPIITKKFDVVIGTRMKNTKGMPFIKIIGNFGMNFITWLIYGKWTTDSQSGLRAFSLKAIKKIRLRSIGYEISSEIIGAVKIAGLKMIEIPIKTIYSQYSITKGQNIFNAINIVIKLLVKKLTK